jgi:predicted amino acid dehydrogenase
VELPVKTQYKSDIVNTIIKTVVSVSNSEKVFLNVRIWKIIMPANTLNRCFFQVFLLLFTSSSTSSSFGVESISSNKSSISFFDPSSDTNCSFNA